ncbi:MAG: PQ-loop domain-containing transporter [Candidatus Geothermincolia bacterium]
MDILYALQIIGGSIMILGYYPQIRQILVTRSVRDLNIKTFLFLCLGLSMMEAYAIGLVVHNHTGGAFLITNTVALMVNLFVVGLIAFFSTRKPGKSRFAAVETPVE